MRRYYNTVIQITRFNKIIKKLSNLNISGSPSLIKTSETQGLIKMIETIKIIKRLKL